MIVYIIIHSHPCIVYLLLQITDDINKSIRHVKYNASDEKNKMSKPSAEWLTYQGLSGQLS
jgi:hypothetical protein